MIREIDAYELDYTISQNGQPIDMESRGIELSIDDNNIAFTCDNLHDQQKVEAFLKWADKLTPDEFEKRLSGT